MKKNLIFVYNANEDLFSQVTDYVHKILSPKTYACNLCSLTHTNFGMKKDWKEFIQTINADLEFLHKDEFCTKYPNYSQQKLPAIFNKIDESQLEIFVNQTEVDEISNLENLKNLIQTRLQS